MTHTPGPWSSYKNQFEHGVRTTRKRKNRHPKHRNQLICKVHQWNDECAANARLIAAAPDLLAALERCYEVFNMDDVDTAISMQCGMAISKAKGEMS